MIIYKKIFFIKYITKKKIDLINSLLSNILKKIIKFFLKTDRKNYKKNILLIKKYIMCLINDIK